MSRPYTTKAVCTISILEDCKTYVDAVVEEICGLAFDICSFFLGNCSNYCKGYTIFDFRSLK